MKFKKHSIEDVAQAIEAKNGFLSLVAESLGVSYQAVWERIQKSTYLQEKIKTINERQLDFSESQLMKKIKDCDLGAICFHLKCKGKHRGYVERQEVTGADGKAIDIRMQIKMVKPS